MPRPWWRKTNKAWYVTINGQQELLCKAPSKSDRKGQDKADRELQKLLAVRQSMGYDATIAGVLKEFLEWSQTNQSAKTYRGYKDLLQSFLDHVEVAFVRQLKPIHITKWLDAHKPKGKHVGWGPSGRRAAIVAVKRALNWAVEQGLIEKNPVFLVKLPPPVRREVLISDETHRKVLRAVGRSFRRVVRVMRATGCRPIEVRTVTAKEVNLELEAWVFPVGHPANKTGKRTRRPRVTYLTKSVQRLVRALIKRYPTGPLFRNKWGKPWTSNAFRLRWKHLREKLSLPAGTCAYAIRHTYTTEGLERGVPVATMAELLGHQDLGMISRHYGHLAQKSQHLLDAAEQAAAVRSSSGKS
ncbi:MAG: tyrosine-type recombinase/integrase [Thermoguttaceae bacterium]